MIERIALDNFRDFENFEWHPGRVNLISGNNGAGKSVLLDTIFGLTGVVVWGMDPSILFLPNSISRGSDSKQQRLELDVAIAAGSYEYSILVEHDDTEMVSVHEVLKHNGETVLDLDVGVLTKGDHQSEFFKGLSGLKDQGEPQIVAFCEYLKRVVFTSRSSFTPTIVGAEQRLQANLLNFPQWFNRNKLGKRAELQEALSSCFGCHLSAILGSQLKIDPKEFHWLSSGEKALWCQRLIASGLEADSVLMLDDPELHMALGHIQPWFQGLLERIEATNSQLFATTHHPELVDLMGGVADHWWLGKMRTGKGRSIHRQSSPSRALRDD